jgi:NADH dehydrogenase [ubiquinone] 1 alpha subcomplex assembly factor 5
MSNLGLHWINDLVGNINNLGVLKQINTSLKEDGLFLGSMLGEDTLFELR